MKIDQLLELPESKTLEFKSDLSSLHPILKTMIAFANTAGGILVIGRSQNGELVGCKEIFKTEEKLANAIADSIASALLPEIEIVTLQGKDLLIVKSSLARPLLLKKAGHARRGLCAFGLHKSACKPTATQRDATLSSISLL